MTSKKENTLIVQTASKQSRLTQLMFPHSSPSLPLCNFLPASDGEHLEVLKTVWVVRRIDEVLTRLHYSLACLLAGLLA